mgnify:CR=1 FL=1
MDRRRLIAGVSLVTATGAVLGMLSGDSFVLLLTAAFLVGGTSNPLYSLLLAYTNDFLDFEDMAAASGGLVFVNGLGAIAGPLVTGWLMSVIGPYGYFTIIAALLLALAGYAAYRMTQRPSPTVDETSAYTPVMPTASVVAVEAAQEYSAEMAEDAENDDRQ